MDSDKREMEGESMGALKYTCNRCGKEWEIEISEEMAIAKGQHEVYLRHPHHPELDARPQKDEHGVELPAVIKFHKEFRCSKCKEMRNLSITQIK